MKTSDLISFMVRRCFECFPNITRLAVAAAVIITSTAANERGFSDMKLHKTRLRSTMQNETLEQLMRISLEGPDIGTPEFEEYLERAVELWSGKKDRRYQYSWNRDSKIKIARRERRKQHKKEEREQKRQKELKDAKESKNAITRREKRNARALAAATKQASDSQIEEVNRSSGVSSNVVDEDLDNAALSAMAQDPDDGKEKAKAAAKRKKKKIKDAQKLLAELEKRDAPRRRQNSRAFLESVQNSLAFR